MVYRSVLFLTLLAVLTGCGLSNAPVQTKYYPNCADNSKMVDAVDWSQAEKIKISYKDRSFETALLDLEKGKPYILQFENTEDFPHWFRAVDFFRDSLIAKATYNNTEMPSTCLEGLALEGMSTAEVHLVPVTANDYEFEDSPFVIPALGEILWNSDTGYIFVR
jgi:endogenous inhibitor of DNA gyrase (YacG/DUF329 family)